MDPLSITVSIIAVLQAANSIIITCYDFKAAVKGAPWALSQVISGIQDLRRVLETLDHLADEDNNPLSPRSKRRSLKLLCEPKGGPLSTCLTELQQLGEIIGLQNINDSTSKGKALLRAVEWQFKEKDVTRCLERIERCKSTLLLAVAASEVDLLRSIHDLNHSLSLNLSDLSTRLDDFVKTTEDKNLSEKHRTIIQWLSTANPAESHETAMRAHQQGTNSWFVECSDFKRWLEIEGSCLWLTGLPGAGKTILFANTVDHLRACRPDSYVAYFYCDFRQKEGQDIVNIMGSLVAQICTQSGFFPQDLEEAFSQSTAAPGQKQRPSLPILTAAIETVARRHDILLLLDAVDECQQRQAACDFLTKTHSLVGNIRILITSRDDGEIQAGLPNFARVRLEKHMGEVRQDVSSYITRRLSNDRELQWLTRSLKEDIAKSLKEKSEGMFRWVQCQIDAIEKLRTVKAVRAALQQLPKGLDETYANILSRITESDVEIARKALLWVTFAVFPVTLDEVYEAIAIESGVGIDEESRLRYPEDIFDLCGSLVSTAEDDHVRLAHLSVKEYLTGTTLQSQGPLSTFSMDSNLANLELAVNCITYLSFPQFASGPCTTAEEFAGRKSQYPLLTYAALSWTYFIRSTKMTPELHRLVVNFFSPPNRSTFLSWVQVLNAINGSWDSYPKHATPLYYAASFGLTELVGDLIQKTTTIDLDAPGSRFGGTALHAAVIRNHLGVMRLLLEAGADPSKGDFHAITPLHHAASYGSVDVVKMLLAYGASTTSRTKGRHLTPLGRAVLYGNEAVAALLLGPVTFPLRMNAKVPPNALT